MRNKRRPGSPALYARLWDDVWDVVTGSDRSWYAAGPYPNDWAWVTDQLATGGMPTTTAEVTNLVRAGITHVINVSDEWPLTAARVLAPDERIRYTHNPTPDDGRLKGADWFGPTVALAKAAIENGDRVLVHCLCGSNRGPSSAYAVLRAMGTPADVAEHLIRQARPYARLRYLPDAELALPELT